MLTWLLTAVSQQFFHMLRLGKLGQQEVSARLKQVDDIDFPNAMQIIDLLLSHGHAVAIQPHRIAPAKSLHAILRTELRFELRLKAFLETLDLQSLDAQARLAQAHAPRDAYRDWLSESVMRTPANPEPAAVGPQTLRLVTVLLQLMEQTLLHAFALWQDGQRTQASTTWQISGAAMLYLTTLSEFCGTDDPHARGIEIPGATACVAEERFASDIQRVRDCASAARQLAAEAGEPKLRALSQRIADDCDRVAKTAAGQPIAAKLGRSAVFQDFSRARARMHA
ncbi:MAG: hypothetical protein AAGC57_19245 [Pseudomonadota bacterium]